MEFAKKQMLKYGWEEGKGLGKNEDGIATAIKPKLKFDKAGIGHKVYEEQSKDWWQRLYNESLNNIDLKQKSKNPLETSTKKNNLRKHKSEQYSSFVKTSKLTCSGIEHYKLADVDSDEQMSSSEIVPLTDEQLFAACGGRTAHKGARHGLKLSGKLSRIEKQEMLLLKKMKDVNLSDDKKLAKKVKRLSEEKEKLISEMEEGEDSTDAVSTCSGSSLKGRKRKGKKNVSFNDKVKEYIIPLDIPNESDDVNLNEWENLVEKNVDEGIEHDIEIDKNANHDDHKSFEEPQFVVSDLSKAERKKLKKKRKLENQKAASKFIASVNEKEPGKLGEDNLNEIYKYFKKCKKRKLGNPETVAAEVENMLHEKTKKLKKKKKKQKDGEDCNLVGKKDTQMKHIIKSMRKSCKI